MPLLVEVKTDQQIALPSSLMKKLDISVGDYLEMDEQDGQIVMRSVKSVFSGKKHGRSLPKTGKWAQVAERQGNLLDREAGEMLRKASREFRENFEFRTPPHFEGTEK